MASMTNVLILINLPAPTRNKYYDYLRQKFPELTVNIVDHHSKVGPYIGAADVIICFRPDIADHVLKEGKNLKWIQSCNVGLDNLIDLPSMRSDIILTNMVGIQVVPMAEAALTVIFALSRGLPKTLRNQDRHVWERWQIHVVQDKTVGIFGVGRIGAVLAGKCKALGMKVIGIDPAKPNVAACDRMVGWNEAAAVLPELDFVVSYVPSEPETRGLMGAAFFAAMKPSAYFINLGREAVVDDAALIAALQQNRIAGAALDVFAEEPLPENHPFWSLENLIITPHLGGFADDYVERSLPTIDENMRKFLAGDTQHMRNLIKH
jgi:phosphoglycerate dehydrogenase-like enzyme